MSGQSPMQTQAQARIIGFMSTRAIEDVRLVSEPVYEWRLEQLEAAGYSPFQAQLLSRTPEVDLHLAVGLLEAGCPVETALRILL